MKKPRKLVWHIYPWFLLITLLLMIALLWYIFDFGRDLFLDRTRADLRNQGYLLRNSITDLMKKGHLDAIDRLCKTIGRATPTRITVILPDGTVVGDSEKNPDSMDYHGNRPEIITAFRTGQGSSMRFSATLDSRMVYVAIRLSDKYKTLGALRTAIAVTAIDKALHAMEIRTAVGGIVIALLAAVASLYISRKISHPIEEITHYAELYSQGDLSHRLPALSSMELARLSETLNNMAIELEDRIHTVVRQRNEYESVLSSMVEGVIAIDKNEVILSINQAALAMLKITSPTVTGRTIHEAVRNRKFLDFVNDSLSGKQIENHDVELQDDKKRIINMRSMSLRDASHRTIGSLIVLNDVTQVRNLENIRKDFVANVSHEIKTPLTAIKGFVETLQQAIDEKQKNALKFLSIIDRHVNRLNAIVEDLLTLARIEQTDDNATVNLEKTSLGSAVDNAVNVVQHQAALKNITFDLRIPDDDIHINVDATLFEQALVNLLDNAVTYSPENEQVTVTAKWNNRQFIICISDRGIGISPQHLPRLFERFYRVDKARSRKNGGTGLGLAIVKHIAQIHGGSVTVESEPGKGSIFCLHFPFSTQI